MKKTEESYYIHQYTLRNGTTKSIKIEPWCWFGIKFDQKYHPNPF